MFFVNQNIGWIVGWGGSVLKTIDGGLNWFMQSIPTSNALTSVFFLDINEGWIVGYYGTIIHTTGGNSQNINLLSPNGNENIPKNSEHEITWTSQGVDSVNVYFSLDDGLNWSEIISRYFYTGNYGQYLWSVPDTTSDYCLVKIESSLNESIFDKSDQSFKIIDSTTSVDWDNDKSYSFALIQNYPNPFNPTTTIKIAIPKSSFISLKVYDLLGREVATLVNEEKTAGNYEAEFNGSTLSSGIYFYKLQTENYTEVKKMILLK
jgi:hypothetical protein